jgi:CheY-like chemotaxis protein
MKTILLIEDNQDIRENAAEFLQLANYNVIAVANGMLGVEAAKKQIPDLILCDIMMPVLDGFGVFIALNKNPYTAGIPFIFLSAKTEMSDIQYGMSLGADDYITKPFDPDFLLSTIKNRIEKNEKVKKEIEWQIFDYVKELEEMLHMTSHRVRAPLCTCLGLIQVLEMENAIPSKEEVKTFLNHIKTNISDLDNFTRELNDSLNNAREKKMNKLGKSAEWLLYEKNKRSLRA